MYVDVETITLLNKLGNDAVLNWEFSETGMPFQSTYLKVVQALYELNQTFVISGVASLGLLYEYLEIPPEYVTEFEKSHSDEPLDAGWGYECYEGYDGPWIEGMISHSVENNRVIFILDFSRNPCSAYLDCMGYEGDCDEFA